MAYQSSRESVAYDYDEMISHFSRGAGTAEAEEPQQAPQLQAIPGGRASANQNTLFQPKVLMTILVVLMVAGIMLHSYMRVTELTSKVANGRTQLDELHAINTALLTKQEYTLSDESIEEYAKDAGMFKLDNSQVEWFEMSNPDKVEISGGGAGIGGVLDQLMQSFNAALAYLN